jgi:uncharacterized protein
MPGADARRELAEIGLLRTGSPALRLSSADQAGRHDQEGSMTQQLPYVSYLQLGSDPHLIAQECSSCGALFLDRRNACASCGALEFAERHLSGDGTVRAFTIVHRATPDVKVPYVSAIVDLDGGGVVKANLVGVEPDPEQVYLGMRVRLTTFGVGTDSEGVEAVGFGYEPA